MAWRAAPYDCGYGKGYGKGGKDRKGGKWNYAGWTNKGSHKAARPGEFRWSSAVALRGDPEIRPGATYSYTAKSSATVDVLTPAWSVRRLRDLPEGEEIDLSLERGLSALQSDDGGFELTTKLASTLGLEAPDGMLALAGHADAEAFGALLAIKVVRFYKGEQQSPALRAICSKAERLACQRFELANAGALRGALDSLGSGDTRRLWTCGSLPEEMVSVLTANFAPSARWSFYELWAELLPASTMRALNAEGAIMCPRFFLVDLASAPLSPYEVEKDYPLIRLGACLFVGQPPDADTGGRDAMRQGRQLEAELLSYGWIEEDHVLTEVILPRPAARQGGNVRAVFSAAPDAVENDGLEVEPLTYGDEDYEAAGYSLAKVFPGAPGKHESCRLWRGTQPPMPPEAYVEVKKTTHLNGRPGQFKMLKFWLQAALMGCGAVVVATTEGSEDGDTVKHLQRFSLSDLAAGVEAARVWGLLAEMLHYVHEKTADSQGPWTLRVEKARGPHSPVQFSLRHGWEGEEKTCGGSGGSSSIMERLADVFRSTDQTEHQDSGEPTPGETIEAYWPDEDVWLPASVSAARAADMITIAWAEDGSLSDVPVSYVRRKSDSISTLHD